MFGTTVTMHTVHGTIQFTSEHCVYCSTPVLDSQPAMHLGVVNGTVIMVQNGTVNQSTSACVCVRIVRVCVRVKSELVLSYTQT